MEIVNTNLLVRSSHHLLLLFPTFQGRFLRALLLLLLLLPPFFCFQALEGAREALLQDVTLQNSDVLPLC